MGHRTDVAMEAIRSDLLTTVRSLCRQPAFSAGIVVILALGLGVNAAMFSFLDRVFLRPPAGVVDPSSLRRFWLIEHDDKGATHVNGLGLGPTERQVIVESVANGASFAAYNAQPDVRI